MCLYKEYVCSAALDAGFTRARILSANLEALLCQSSNYSSGSKSLLVCALPYGNRAGGWLEARLPAPEARLPEPEARLPAPEARLPEPEAGVCPAVIAPFARFNYYREAVKRMKRLAALLRARCGGERGDYRIFCNSQAHEKLIAVESGLGVIGRNGLVITHESGSLFIIALMALPVTLESDLPVKGASGAVEFPLCADCGENPPCAAACPTGAVLGNGCIDRSRCIQWYASGRCASKSDVSDFDVDGVPAAVRSVWGARLYGCVSCQDACVHNQRPIQGVQTDEGRLPAFIDAHELLRLADSEIKSMFKGTAMGLSWLGPAAIRRNAKMVLASQSLR